MLDQNKIENVQRAATRLVQSIKHLTYEQRIQELKLPTLKHRRQRGDMICVYVYSLLNNIYDLDYSFFFTLASSVPTRGHPLKLFKPQILRDVSSVKGSYINDWNRLEANIITAPSLSNFKQLYYKQYDAGL